MKDLELRLTDLLACKADEVDVHLDPNDLQIDVYRSSGPGGQSVNTTDSAVRITHLPTGIVVTSSLKSQHQNRDIAMKVLRARLHDRERQRTEGARAADRKAQVGSGGRAEKIRTYNYGERRVKDNRINLLVHNLDEVLEGVVESDPGKTQSPRTRDFG